MEEARPGPICSAQVQAMPPVPAQRLRPVLLAEAPYSLPLPLDKRHQQSLSSAILVLLHPQVLLQLIRPSLLPRYLVSQRRQPARLLRRSQSLPRVCLGQPQSQVQLSSVVDQAQLRRLSPPQTAPELISSVAGLHQPRRLVRNQLACSELLQGLRPRRHPTSLAVRQPLRNLQSQLLAQAQRHFLVRSPLRQRHQPAAPQRPPQPRPARACLAVLLLAVLLQRPRNHPLCSLLLRARPRPQHLQLHLQRPLLPIRRRRCSVPLQRRPPRLRALLQAPRLLPRQLRHLAVPRQVSLAERIPLRQHLVLLQLLHHPPLPV